jgi:hypothetical protein
VIREGFPDEELTPVPFTKFLDEDGLLDVELQSTGATWAWAVEALLIGVENRDVEYVLVPYTSNALSLSDLTRVDPLTLEPLENLEMWRALEAHLDLVLSEVNTVASTVAEASVLVTSGPDFPDTIRISYPAYLSPEPNVVRLPIASS